MKLFFTKSSSTEEGKNVVHVFLATDEALTRPTSVAVTSLLENKNLQTFYYVYIMIPGSFKPENRMTIKRLDEKYENCEISMVDMGEMFEEDSYGKYTAPAYYRQEIPRLFPCLKKCIYLDGDVIVRHDLSRMADINLDDYYVAGIVEYWFVDMKESVIRSRLLEIPDVKGYICTGVMVMNLENMRANGFVEKISRFSNTKIKILREYPGTHPDQDVLNAVCYGKTLSLAHRFGVMINFHQHFPKRNWKRKDPTIIHFSGRPKPWNEPKSFKKKEWSIFHEEFWHYAEKTGLYSEEIKERKEKQGRYKKIPLRRPFKN